MHTFFSFTFTIKFPYLYCNVLLNKHISCFCICYRHTRHETKLHTKKRIYLNITLIPCPHRRTAPNTTPHLLFHKLLQTLYNSTHGLSFICDVNLGTVTWADSFKMLWFNLTPSYIYCVSTICSVSSLTQSC